MWVYGDHSRIRHPREMIAELRRALGALPGEGLARHAALTTALVTAGELVQGLADADFATAGVDRASPQSGAAMAVLMAAAQGVTASWRSGHVAAPAPDPAALDPLAALDLPNTITVKQAEGYAFYAVYPEAYAAAALDSGLGAHTQVIGLRSIGASLAAVVAAALGAPAPVTLRPVGHPFQRQLSLAAALQARLLADAEARYAIVDEGPGLSGSSMGCVADWLEDHGVASERIVFFPSHGGDLGALASDRHRQRWSSAARFPGDFERLAGGRGAGALVTSWAEALTGPAMSVRDLSGGGWRCETYTDEALWPAVDTFQERRKFKIATAHGDWLAKFVGLGEAGERKAERAQALAAAGLAPPIAGLRHGFLVSAWSDARPVDLASLDRPRFIDHLARYLGFRATAFPAAPEAGASLDDLLEMMRVNVAEAFGAEAAAPLAAWAARLPRLTGQVVRVETDNRLQACEWLSLPDGGWLKTDAVDHAFAHDLIGAQDIAWDIAGAIAEFALTPPEQVQLCAAVTATSGRPVSSALLAFYRPGYVAFQLGAYAMAAASHGHWPQEQARLAAAKDRYAAALTPLIADSNAS